MKRFKNYHISANKTGITDASADLHTHSSPQPIPSSVREFKGSATMRVIMACGAVLHVLRISRSSLLGSLGRSANALISKRIPYFVRKFR